MRIKTRQTDKLFSNIIRTKHNWTCARCYKKYPRGSQGLHCSHFWSRSHESTRFDENNCVSLCFFCHMFWGHGEGRPQYEAFMKKRLGEDGFKKLDILAHSYQKRDDAIIMRYLKILASEFGLL